MSGKGSRPRPLSISKDEYAQRWDDIFKPKTEVEKFLEKFSNDYQDILSTEECVENALEEYVKSQTDDK